MTGAQPYEFLARALRSPAGSVEELAERLGLGVETLRAELATLESRGFLTVTNDLITYRRPDVAIADATTGILAGAAGRMREAEQLTQELLGSLPALLQAWQERAAEEHTLNTSIIHGAWAAADIWRLHANPRTADVCMPDATAGFQADGARASSYWTERRAERFDVRLLLSVADATHPAAREHMLEEVAAGVQIRMHPHLPSYFWITDHDTVGMPLEWGQGWPTSVMSVSSPLLAAAFSWIYQRLWTEAVPVTGTEQTWEGMLQLMSRGLTMEAAAHTLGLTARTGRRRVADAMEHYGVRSQFSLGAAWGRNG